MSYRNSLFCVEVESKVQSTFNYPRVDNLDWVVHMCILLLFVTFTENPFLTVAS